MPKDYVVEIPLHGTQTLCIKAESVLDAERIANDMGAEDWADHAADFQITRRFNAKARLDR